MKLDSKENIWALEGGSNRRLEIRYIVGAPHKILW